CIWWRVCSSVPRSLMAVSTLRGIAFRRKHILLLHEHSQRIFVSRCSTDRETDRSSEHNGVHAYPIKPLPDCCSVRPQPTGGAYIPAHSSRALADGRANTHVIRDGRRYSC